MLSFENALQDCKIKVNPAYIAEQSTKIVVNCHRFPDTYSVVAHASLDGFELAIASSPCVDPKSFSQAIGEHYAVEKAKSAAVSKLWEIAGIELRAALAEYGALPLNRFPHRYSGKFKIEEPTPDAAYVPPTLPAV